MSAITVVSAKTVSAKTVVACTYFNNEHQILILKTYMPFQKEVKTWKLQRRELEQKRATIEQKMTSKTCELSTIEEEISKVKCVDEGEVRQRAQNRADELRRLDEEVKQKEATENSTFQHGRNVQKTLDDLDQVSNYTLQFY